MKLIVDKEHNMIELKIPTTDKGDTVYYLPTKNVYYWYPFNINFYYKYSNSKDFLYLVKEKNYEGENYYNVDILKRTKPLNEREGVIFHPTVYKRNRYIMDKATTLGLPTVKGSYTPEDVEIGFSELGVMIHTVKNQIEDRLLEQNGSSIIVPEMFSEEWDKSVYEIMTETEREILIEFGEMYAMLTLMRKLVEGS
jgi:hypothetical protein